LKVVGDEDLPYLKFVFLNTKGEPIDG